MSTDRKKKSWIFSDTWPIKHPARFYFFVNISLYKMFYFLFLPTYGQENESNRRHIPVETYSALKNHSFSENKFENVMGNFTLNFEN